MTMPEIEPLLRWFGDHELCEDLWWHSAGWDSTKPLSFFVPCSDMFWWATADAEQVTADDLPELQRAWDDLKATGDCNEVYAPQLWVSRKRGMRPQRPWIVRDRIPEKVQALFCEAGPDRAGTPGDHGWGHDGEGTVRDGD